MQQLFDASARAQTSEPCPSCSAEANQLCLGALSCYLHNTKLTNWSFNVAREPFEFTLHCTLAFLTASKCGWNDQIPARPRWILDAFTPVFRRNKTMSNAFASREKLGHFSIIYPTEIFPAIPFAIIHLTNESKPSHVKCFDTKPKSIHFNFPFFSPPAMNESKNFRAPFLIDLPKVLPPPPPQKPSWHKRVSFLQ